MIDPDNLAARFAAPLTSGPLYARQVAFTDDAYTLAERVLDVLPRGHHLDQAVLALETAAHMVCAGLAAVHDERAAAAVDADLTAAVESLPQDVDAGLAAALTALPDPDEQPVPYVLGGTDRPPLPERPVPGLVVPDTLEGLTDLGLDLDVTLWRSGLRTTSLHPLARLVAHVLTEAADAHGYIRDADQPDITDLMGGTGLDAGAVLQALEELATSGWIGRHNDGGRTRYQLRMPTPNPQR